jgi:hypothetical protein
MGGGGFVPVMPLYGNPGDYAWGRGGLDAVVTSLLNQMEGAGPAPMPTDNIGQIPKVKISKSQVGKPINQIQSTLSVNASLHYNSQRGRKLIIVKILCKTPRKIYLLLKQIALN